MCTAQLASLLDSPSKFVDRVLSCLPGLLSLQAKGKRVATTGSASGQAWL
jgi:hypothetical protein